ncbi:MAG: hypothetical protein ACM3TT_09285, partial [Syntrophothermus sp.]
MPDNEPISLANSVLRISIDHRTGRPLELLYRPAQDDYLKEPVLPGQGPLCVVCLNTQNEKVALLPKVTYRAEATGSRIEVAYSSLWDGEREV